MFNSYILLIGYARPGNDNPDNPGIECYKGKLFITKNTTQEEKEKEPKLEVCGDTQVCLSTYFQTDVTYKSGTILGLAGSWWKRCEEKSSKLITYPFGEDLSDRCYYNMKFKEEAKEKERVKVCTINADFCLNVCNLIYVSIYICNSDFHIII